MILTIKHKYSYYRRFELDIWGSYYTSVSETQDLNSDWKLRFFYKIYLEWQAKIYKRMRRYIYRIDIIEKFTFKKSFDRRFLSIRLTRLYFLTFQDYQFRQLFKMAGKMDGNLEENYIHFLEGRLLAIVYRMNFIFDIFECMRVIKEKYIYVNFVNKTQFNKCIKVGDFISIKSKYLDFIKFNCDIRGENEAFLFNIPQFLFVSYYFFFAFLLYKPRRKELVYPISLDIQRITGYY